MGQDQVEFRILFRKPVYPVIVISEDRLMVASNLNKLAKNCLTARMRKGEKVIKAIDSSAEEFWYSPDNFVFAPGFAFKRWTKKQIIELYNDCSNAKELDKKYPLKSISNKRLSRIIADICEILKSQQKIS
jgi:hypothetical protein